MSDKDSSEAEEENIPVVAPAAAQLDPSSRQLDPSSRLFDYRSYIIGNFNYSD